MYLKNYLKKSDHRIRRAVILAVSFLLLITGSVFGTLSYLTDGNASVVNTMIPGKVTTTVTEDFKNGVKSNVKIQNTGNVTAWLRAAVVVTWQDQSGNVSGTPAATTDYDISYDLTNGWLKGDDGFYYWNAPVAPQGLTGVLVSSCSKAVNADLPEGYELNVEIIGSGIQDAPADAFASWGKSSGLKIENGRLVKGK